MKDNKFMKIKYKIFVISIVFGLLTWILDTCLDFLFFYKGSYFDLLIFNVPKHELYVRFTGILIFLIFGYIIIKFIEQLDRPEAALRESEEHLSITLESIGDAVIATDIEGKVVRMNNVAEKLTGWEKTEATGKHLNDIFNIYNTVTRERAINPVKRVIEEGEIIGSANHTMLIARDGTEYQITDSAAPIYNFEGRVVGVVLVFRDMTEEYRIQEELKKISEEQQIIFDSVPTAIWYKDTENRILRVNRTGAESVGMSPEDIEGKTAYELFPDEADHYYEDDLEVIKSGKPKLGIVEQLQTSSGKKLWVQTDKIPYRDEQDNITGIIVFVIDITERKKTEKALRESEQKINSIIKTIPDIIYRLDPNGNITFISDAVKNYGYSPEELIGTNFMEIIHLEDREKAKYGVNERRTGERRTKSLEIRLLKKNNYAIYFEIETVNIENEPIFLFSSEGLYNTDKPKKESFMGTQGTARDITDRKKAEKERTEAIQDAERAMHLASIGGLTSGIVHEINQPLNVLKMTVDLILYTDYNDYLTQKKELKEKIIFISEQVENINNIIRNMRILTQKGQNNESQQININKIIMKVITSVNNQLQSNGINVELKLDDVLPYITGQQIQMEQVVTNLFTNAINALKDYSKKDKKISISTKFKNNNCIIEFYDNGPGILEELLDRIFDPFFTSHHISESMGLGLFITKNIIITGFGGSIIVKSSKERGAYFTISIPVLKKLK